MSEIGNQILSRFDKMEQGLKEAFPWFASLFPPNEIYDANHNHVLTLSGFDGDIFNRQAIGVAERSRMILEIPAMIEQLRKIARHYQGFPYADQAQAILDRIEGKQET